MSDDEGGGDDDGAAVVADAEFVESGPVGDASLVSQQTDAIRSDGRHEASSAIRAKARNAKGQELDVKEKTSFSGPLPHPNMLKAYNDACPGAGDRILAMAEEEGKHRRQLEKDGQFFVLKKTAEDDRRGQWMGFALMLAAMAIGTLLILMGYVAGVITLFTALTTFAGVAIWRRIDERKVQGELAAPETQETKNPAPKSE